MSDLVDLSSLSEDIREKLAELELELSEGKVFNIKMGNISSHSHYMNYYLNIACGLCFECLILPLWEMHFDRRIDIFQ